MENSTELAQLIAVTAKLRAAGGCPWCAEQSHESLVRYLIEECYELIDAIESGDRDAMLEELGDVLYQVLFHADIAKHDAVEDFDVQDVAKRMRNKMISRHPHVFGDQVAKTTAEVTAGWESMKRAEKPERHSVLDGVPFAMPSLLLADKLLGKTELLKSVRPEPIFVQAMNSEEEFGDYLLALVLSARANGIDTERALRGRLAKYREDVQQLEQESAQFAADHIEEWKDQN